MQVLEKVNNEKIESKEPIEIKRTNKRITYIDTAKAIGIFLVIISHSGLGYHPINHYICSFHMPLFFFIAGWTQKNNKLSTVKEWREFIVKKVFTLLVPYLLYALIYTRGSDLLNYKYIIYGNILSLVQAKSIGTIWFLPCMFMSVLIYQMTINILSNINNKYAKYSIGTCLIILYGCVSSYFNFYKMPTIGVPFSANIALTGVIFMFAGKGISLLWNQLIEKFKKIDKKKYIFIMSMLLLGSGIILYQLNFKAFTFEKYNLGIVMAEAWYGNYIMFLINAVICSLGVVLLSMAIDNKFLQYFGKNTLIILYFHIQANAITKTYITKSLPNGIYKYFLNSVLVFLEMGLVIPIINRYFPNLAGKYIKDDKKTS